MLGLLLALGDPLGPADKKLGETRGQSYFEHKSLSVQAFLLTPVGGGSSRSAHSSIVPQYLVLKVKSLDLNKT